MSSTPDNPNRDDLSDEVSARVPALDFNSNQQPTDPATPTHQVHTVLIGLIVWLTVAVYLLPFVTRGWIPHDEGLLAHSAERVLNGELPHQDFDDCYTGGLAFLHSVSFRLFGIHLSAMRWTLFGGTMLFVPLLYLLAIRCCTPVVAGLVTIVCITWSVPNYFASMPSWYILFFTMAALYCLTRFVRSESWPPLWISGLCCGLAVLCKINGLFAVAMGLLFLLYHDQVRSQKVATSNSSTTVRLMSTAIAVSWSTMVFLLLRRQLEAGMLINLLIPSVIASTLLTWNEWVNGRGNFSQRAATLTKDVMIFLSGTALPVAVCLIPFAINGTVNDVIHGVVVLPQQRLANAAQSFPPVFAFLTTIPMCMLLFCGWQSRDHDPARDRRVSIAVFTFAATAIVFTGSWAVHSSIWLSVRLLPPLAVLAVGLFLVRNSQHLSDENRQTLVLLLLGTTTLSLIQFPFAANIYFCYFAPLLILMIVYFRSIVPGRVPGRESGILVFFLLFAVASLNRCYVAGGRFPYDKAQQMKISRASLLSRPQFAEYYPEVIDIVQRHSESGDAIYAAPDCPEIYFLADRKNPTRTMYDFFDSPQQRTDKLIRMLSLEDITVVVINFMPEFSSKMDQRLQQEVLQKFPIRQQVGPFIVAYRNRTQSPSDEASPIPATSVTLNTVTTPGVNTPTPDTADSVYSAR